ncbi:MAG: hypothetical protein NC211_07680 [Alistipes senegalensis]|nr:hypothetical protein [Oxalobacter formigenes]MCM1281688.1 hypothetical protein [Alistipes senegalensis]
MASYYARAKGINLEIGPGLPCLDLRGMPKDNLIFTSSQNSAGLELVDIYLWIFKRWVEKKAIPPNLYFLVNKRLRR